MLTESTSDTATRSTAERIRQAAERCTRIVKTFLAIARQESPERAPTQVNEVIESSLDLVIYSLRTAGIEIHLDLDTELPEFFADAVQLQQVFTNLLVNAQQALLEAPEPRQVQIATRLEAMLNQFRVIVEMARAFRRHSLAHLSRLYNEPVGAVRGRLSLSRITAHDGTVRLGATAERFVSRLDPMPTAIG